MIGWIRRKIASAPVQFLPPQPDAPFYAVGDIHGRIDLLDRLLAKMNPAHPIVFVGDYVDRGENSAKVLARLVELQADPIRTVYCLKGNHEDMLLGFLDDPEKRGKAWLRSGGLQTLASFGVSGLAKATTDDGIKLVANALRVAMGAELIDWLRGLPVYWVNGMVTVVHAGADPAESIEAQSPRNLIWGHRDFHSSPRKDGIWVVHGHRIVDDPVCANGIISIDTGAYATGRLTAALIEPGKVEFNST